MMVLAVFLAGVIVLWILDAVTAVFAVFLAAQLLCGFWVCRRVRLFRKPRSVCIFECGCGCAFPKTSALYNSRVIITRARFLLQIFALAQNNWRNGKLAGPIFPTGIIVLILLSAMALYIRLFNVKH